MLFVSVCVCVWCCVFCATLNVCGFARLLMCALSCFVLFIFVVLVHVLFACVCEYACACVCVCACVCGVCVLRCA